MRNFLQSYYLSLGEESCFFLQLLNIAEQEIGCNLDPLSIAIICKHKNFIYLNLDNLKDKKNFLIYEHAKILELLTGKKWQYEKAAKTYKAKKNEYVINEYQNGSNTHFDSDNFHSLQDSITIKNGKIVTKRVFRIV